MRHSGSWLAVVAGASVLVAGCLEISDADEAGPSDSGSANGGSGTGGIGTDGWASGGSAPDGSGGTGNNDAGQTFAARGVVFDGVGDWLDLQSSFNDAMDSKQVTGSFWFKRVGLDQIYCIGPEATGSAAPNQLEWTAANEFHIEWRRAGGGTACSLLGSPITDTASWHHIAFSVDTADGSKSQLYLDGVADLADQFVTGFDLDNTGSQWGLFANHYGGSSYHGEVAEFWLALGQYVDLANQENLEKFRIDGKPADPGTGGEVPTGAPPTIYLSVRPGDPPTIFAFNRGVGGSFVQHGTLDIALSSPSD